METTQVEKDNLRTIIQALVDGDAEWLNRQEIHWGDKGQYWVLNYAPGGRNEYNRLVRGMVVRKVDGFNGDPLSLIASFPFVRFLNKAEKGADPVDMSNAEMLEKMDGTMVGVFFPNELAKNPNWHTRKMVSDSDQDMQMQLTSFYGKRYEFMPLIGTYVLDLKFHKGDMPHTYVFEFIHEASAVLTKYKKEQYGLYLLGARNIETHRESCEDQLDEIADRIGAFRPRRWDSIDDQSEIQRMMDEINKDTPDFEGYVFRDRNTGKRVKVKDPGYVEKHHFIGELSMKRLVPKVLEGEEEEIISYFPHAKEKTDLITAKLNELIDLAVGKVKKWQDKNLTQKNLAYELFGKQMLKKWEIKLQKIRGEKEEKATPGEDCSTMRSIILQNINVTDERVLRDNIFTCLSDIGRGSDAQRAASKKEMEKRKEAAKESGEWINEEVKSGNAGKFMDLIGLRDEETPE